MVLQCIVSNQRYLVERDLQIQSDTPCLERDEEDQRFANLLAELLDSRSTLC